VGLLAGSMEEVPGPPGDQFGQAHSVCGYGTRAMATTTMPVRVAW
jgi:hypothetical protein